MLALADETTDANNGVAEETTSQEKEFNPISSQEELDQIIQARIARERNKFADYDDIKAKAERLDEIEEANKSEIEKKEELLKALQVENETLKLEALRSRVAAEKGVPANLLNGTTEEEINAAADALIEFKGAHKDERLHVPSEGRRPVSGSDTSSQFADFFESKF